MGREVTFTQHWTRESIPFRRKPLPPRWRLGFSRRFPWLAYRETDHHLACYVTGKVNSRPWRGAQPRTVLVTGASIDKDVTFTVDHGQHDLRILDDGAIRTFQVHAACDFNNVDLGEPVIPAWAEQWVDQLALAL